MVPVGGAVSVGWITAPGAICGGAGFTGGQGGPLHGPGGHRGDVVLHPAGAAPRGRGLQPLRSAVLLLGFVAGGAGLVGFGGGSGFAAMLLLGAALLLLLALRRLLATSTCLGLLLLLGGSGLFLGQVLLRSVLHNESPMTCEPNAQTDRSAQFHGPSVETRYL